MANRKDIRNAVEAAHAAKELEQRPPATLRAQILYYIAENLSARGDEFAARINALTGARKSGEQGSGHLRCDRLFSAMPPGRISSTVRCT